MKTYIKLGAGLVAVGAIAAYLTLSNSEKMKEDGVQKEPITQAVEPPKKVVPQPAAPQSVVVEEKVKELAPEVKAEPLVAEKAIAETTPAAPMVAKSEDGASLYQSKGCVTCHGEESKGAVLDYPHLAGQNAKYLAQQVEDIIAGKRIGQKNAAGQVRTDVMRAVLVNSDGSSMLSDQEITDITDWLASLSAVAPQVPAEPISADRLSAGEKLYKEKKCQTCHGKEGMKPVNKAYPYLAGQKSDYLVRQISDIKEKIRTNGKSKTMYPFVKNMTEEEIAFIADYLSQLDRLK